MGDVSAAKGKGKKGIKKTLRAIKKRILRKQIAGELEQTLTKAEELNHKDILTPEADLDGCMELTRFVSAHSSLLSNEEKIRLTQPVARLLSANRAELSKQRAEETGMMTDLLWDLEKSSQYRRYIRSVYIKEEIPAAYNKERNTPVGNRIVFLQPRSGLNQSFRYIFNKIEKEYPYEPVLYEFHIREVPYIEHYVNATEFAREMATARAVMLHESSIYLGYVDVRPETKVVQLWHGCGVIKHLGLSNAGKQGYKSLEAFKEYPEYNNYDIVTIAAEELRWVFEEFMGKEKGDPVISPVGMSRTDEFYDEEFVQNCCRKIHEIIPASKDKKIILYAPTYRGVDPDRVAPEMPDLKMFADRLADDYVFVIKQHQTVKKLPEIPENIRESFAYDMTRGRGMNINELMTVADIMISDYSSVVYEYSIFERPIIFYLYDLEKYAGERGMYYSYEELAEGGEIFRTSEEMVDYIADINQRFDRDRIRAFRQKYMSACDGHATERIMKFIES